MKKYKKEEVIKAAAEYFGGDELAANVWVNKYCLKDRDVYYELTPEKMHRRLAKEFARIEAKYKDPMNENEIFELLKGFKYLIPQGSPMAGIGNPFAITSISNCFVIGGHVDAYGGIMLADQEQAQLMKRRGGVGQDISYTRPAGAIAGTVPLGPNAGTVLYMDRFSNTTKEVQQDGRRGALMLSLSIDHPDAESFIDRKMIAGQVTGANVSVKITEKFMDALVNYESYFYQTFPIQHNIDEVLESGGQRLHDQFYYGAIAYDELIMAGKIDGVQTYFKKVNPKKIWDKIVHNAWKSAEPGILFWDQILKESPAAAYGIDWKEASTNPCFTGDTKVMVADGRGYVTFKELAKSGEDVEVFCADENGDLVTRTMRKPRKTGNKKVYKVLLDNGQFVRATENHKFYLKCGARKELKDLKRGDRLHIVSRVYEDGVKGSNKRVMLHSNGNNEAEHQLICRENGCYESGSDIHHIDDNPYNNSIKNLMAISKADHNKIHDKAYSGELNGNFSGLSNSDLLKLVKEETILKGRRISTKEAKLVIGMNWSKFRKDEFGTMGEFLVNVAQECFTDHNLIYGDMRYIKKYASEKSEFHNHKVVSIIEDSIEDVYNGTVDEFHNYFVGGFDELTRGGHKKEVSVLVANCGEIPLCPYDSCRLLAINLYSYLYKGFSKESMLEDTLLVDHVKKAVRIMDDIVDLEIEKIDKIIESVSNKPHPKKFQVVELELWKQIRHKAVEGRRTGLGILGEADLIAGLGYKYGTKEATRFAECLHQLIATSAMEASIDLAEERGHFPIWKKDEINQSGYLTRMFIGNDCLDPAYQEKFLKYGRRNIGQLTIAPTGSTSLMAQTASGIEPVFNPWHFRKKKITNQDERVDFIDTDGEKMTEFAVFHRPFIDWYSIKQGMTFSSAELELGMLTKDQLQTVFKESPYFEATAQDVDYIEKVRMQGAVQKWVDHSISVTVNMPKGVDEKTVDGVYVEAYISGCKGITVYRDGSRGNILSVESVKEDNNHTSFEYVNAVDRPEIVNCDVFFTQVRKEEFIVFVGKIGDKPYEIFAVPYNKKTKISKRIKEGRIIKRGRGSYYFETDHGKDTDNIIWNICDHMIENEQNETRNLSALLRHRVDPKYIADLIGKYATISSFHKAMQKVLLKYVPKESIVNKCPKCSNKMIMEEGCMRCLDCGYSHCSN